MAVVGQSVRDPESGVVLRVTLGRVEFGKVSAHLLPGALSSRMNDWGGLEPTTCGQ